MTNETRPGQKWFAYKQTITYTNRKTQVDYGLSGTTNGNLRPGILVPISGSSVKELIAAYKKDAKSAGFPLIQSGDTLTTPGSPIMYLNTNNTTTRLDPLAPAELDELSTVVAREFFTFQKKQSSS